MARDPPEAVVLARVDLLPEEDIPGGQLLHSTHEEVLGHLLPTLARARLWWGETRESSRPCTRSMEPSLRSLIWPRRLAAWGWRGGCRAQGGSDVHLVVSEGCGVCRLAQVHLGLRPVCTKCQVLTVVVNSAIH